MQVLAEEGVQKFISCVTWSKTTKCTKISSINAVLHTFWHKNRWLSWSKEALNSIISKVKCIDHGKRKKTYFFLPMQFFDLFCGSHYFKSLIFVQKVNFDKNFAFRLIWIYGPKLCQIFEFLCQKSRFTLFWKSHFVRKFNFDEPLF